MPSSQYLDAVGEALRRIRLVTTEPYYVSEHVDQRIRKLVDQRTILMHVSETASRAKIVRSREASVE